MRNFDPVDLPHYFEQLDDAELKLALINREDMLYSLTFDKKSVAYDFSSVKYHVNRLYDAIRIKFKSVRLNILIFDPLNEFSGESDVLQSCFS